MDFGTEHSEMIASSSEPTRRRSSLRITASSAWWVGLAAALVVGGCTRAHYRRQADEDGTSLVMEKADNPRWSISDFQIYVDPRSRMFDPFNPDGPPMPPDDPTAHQLMHTVDGKKGYPGWHYSGDVPYVESPSWLDSLPTDEKGVLKLDSQNVVYLGRIHSPTYQQQIEELYLSALDVSFERFRFDSQFFAGYSTFFTADGKDRAFVGGDSKSTLNASFYSTGRRPFAMQKLFTTGADLVVGVANSLVWQFSGPDDYKGNTLIDFALVQPLLRNAGRDRVLERLTLAERLLLSNVRAMERYRQGFYVNVLVGQNPGQGPSRSGGVFGGSGLEGFTGTGAGGFGRVAGAVTGQGIAGAGQTGAGAARAGGFIGLLQQQQQLRNQADNVARLRTNLYRLEVQLNEMLTTIPADQEAIPRQRLQVAQARQALFVAESTLVNNRNQYEIVLDTFKGTLGLPPEICVEIDDPYLDQFNLIDESVKSQMDKTDDVIGKLGTINDRILALVKQEEDPLTNVTRRSIEWTEELKTDLEQIREEMKPVNLIWKDLTKLNLTRADSDLQRLRSAVPGRKKELDRLRQKHAQLSKCPCPLLPVPDMDPAVFDAARLDSLDDQLSTRLETLKTRIAEYGERLEELDQSLAKVLEEGPDQTPARLFENVLDEAILATQNVLIDFRMDIFSLELVEVRAKAEAITLVSVDLPSCEAMQIATRYRHDLMNARSQLVDAWRRIEFNADNLESSLDVLFSGDVSNTTDNPLRLKDTTGRLRVGVQFDAPIVRLSERNTYRQSLIDYQQARRNYYLFEDSISRSLRQELRTIETNQLNFELQRFALLVAAEQIDLNEDIRILREAQRQPSGATAARDAVSALNDLLNAQNDFLSIWVNYEVQRRILDYDLGTMRLDNDGIWVDPGPVGPDFGQRIAEQLHAECPEEPMILDEGEPLPPGSPVPGGKNGNDGQVVPPGSMKAEELPQGHLLPPRSRDYGRPRPLGASAKTVSISDEDPAVSGTTEVSHRRSKPRSKAGVE